MIPRIPAAVLVTLFSVTALLGCNRTENVTKDITSAEAKELINTSNNVFLLDVRTLQEREQGYIQGSVLIPIDELEKRVAEVPKDRQVIIYCAVGSRSKAASRLLADKGYTKVYNMRDGIVAWYKDGLPVQR